MQIERPSSRSIRFNIPDSRYPSSSHKHTYTYTSRPHHPRQPKRSTMLIPYDVLLSISHHVPPTTLVNKLGKTCKAFYAISLDVRFARIDTTRLNGVNYGGWLRGCYGNENILARIRSLKIGNWDMSLNPIYLRYLYHIILSAPCLSELKLAIQPSRPPPTQFLRSIWTALISSGRLKSVSISAPVWFLPYIGLPNPGMMGGVEKFEYVISTGSSEEDLWTYSSDKKGGMEWQKEGLVRWLLPYLVGNPGLKEVKLECNKFNQIDITSLISSLSLTHLPNLTHLSLKGPLVIRSSVLPSLAGFFENHKTTLRELGVKIRYYDFEEPGLVVDKKNNNSRRRATYVPILYGMEIGDLDMMSGFVRSTLGSDSVEKNGGGGNGKRRR